MKHYRTKHENYENYYYLNGGTYQIFGNYKPLGKGYCLSHLKMSGGFRGDFDKKYNGMTEIAIIDPDGGLAYDTVAMIPDERLEEIYEKLKEADLTDRDAVVAVIDE